MYTLKITHLKAAKPTSSSYKADDFEDAPCIPKLLVLPN